MKIKKYLKFCADHLYLEIFEIFLIKQNIILHPFWKYINSALFLFCDSNLGWFAAIANLDDVLENFKYQCETFDTAYSRYLETRQENIDLVNRYLHIFKRKKNQNLFGFVGVYILNSPVNQYFSPKGPR